MPMNVCAKPEPGIVTNGQLNDVAIALESIVLPVPGRAEEEHAALALAARLLELLAGLPERDDARDLLLGLGLAADVVELDAPVRVARLVALDLLDAEEQHRPEQDQEVAKNRIEDDRQLHRHRRAERASRSPIASSRAAHRRVAAGERVVRSIATTTPSASEDDQPTRRGGNLLAPVPEPPPRDDVLLLAAPPRRRRATAPG